MARPLPPLSTLRNFEAAARHLSFARAASELGVTAGAVSHQIKLLEAWVGRPLFERRPNGVALTETGRQFSSRLALALDQMLAASISARDPVARATITIRSQFSVATRWLAPRLQEFRLANPHIQVNLSAAPQNWGAHQASPDLAIYHGRPPLPGLRQEKLLVGRMLPVAHPGIVATLPPDATPADLLTLPLIDTRQWEERWTEVSWADWFAAARVGRAEPKPALILNMAVLAIEACLAGAGFALLPDYLIERELAERRLVQVFSTTLPTAHAYYLMTAEANLSREEVATVRDWLLARRTAFDSETAPVEGEAATAL